MSQERDEDALRLALTRAMGRQGTLIADKIIRGDILSFDEVERMFNAAIVPQLTDVAQRASGIALAVSADLDAVVINEAAAAWARDHTFGLVKDLTATTRDVVSRAIQTFITTPGMTRGELEGALRPAFGPARAQAIAVTEVTRASAEATNIAQRQLGGAGIVMERIWHTLGDDLVDTDICRPLNGKPESVWKNQFPDGPPAHVACRCNATLKVA
ncbi:hypothetical protein LCGC14_0313310 [marine sediment metagenome]|uniref:Phage head morphogenesis domain-containing protein n=1 Tax=marine sediment metagenome TaxID=412755 RepID=A0A0F9TRV1_9ZZZZ